ncbi:uncharacterized protein LOC135713425 [Ochlerotatus camptorhynchus]|uniref:uncharacterized protein LOC135713425 n=1 Tax=Ochlerotatus camptorhynchus TaxID=644619 RepID=UPI0031D66F36
MKNSMLVLCLVMMLASWLSEAKPQGCTNCGSSHGEVTERCCNDCELCRVSFSIEKPTDPECPRPKNYSYNVQHINPHCQEEKYETWDAHVEKPKDPACPKKLKLSARVEHNTRDCECPTCWYGNFSNIVYNNTADAEHDCTNKSSHHTLKQNKFYEFRSRGNSIREEFIFDHCFPRKRHKRLSLSSTPINCNDLVKQGYICRCVPDDGTGCINKSQDGEPMVGSIFNPTFKEPEVYVGGSKPPSYDVIRQHITPILAAHEGVSAIQEAKDLAEIYYKIYQRHHEKNLTIPIKYGTRTVETEDNGLRTYDIEPVEGQYDPSALDMFSSVSNNLFGEIIDRVKQGPRFGLFPFRTLRHSKRSQRNSKRKERQVRDKT